MTPTSTPEVQPALEPSLSAEIAAFHEICKKRYRFNSYWDNTLNICGILLSIAIITAGVYRRSDISTILGGLVAALVTAQRAFPFGQRMNFYRVLIGKVENLQTDVTNGMLATRDAVSIFKSLRLDFAQQLPLGSAFNSQEPSGASHQ